MDIYHGPVLERLDTQGLDEHSRFAYLTGGADAVSDDVLNTRDIHKHVHRPLGDDPYQEECE